VVLIINDFGNVKRLYIAEVTEDQLDDVFVVKPEIGGAKRAAL
jgi:hypothetical protein